MRTAFCPLCASDHTSVRYEIPIDLLKEAWQPYLQKFASQGIQIAGTTLWRCTDCDLEFFSPPAPGGADFYSILDEAVSTYYPTEKWEHLTALDYVIRSGSRTVLEMGCGDGTFLKMLQQKGISAAGVDFNVSADKKVDSSIILSDLTRYKTADQFDCVAAFQVLEHLEKPGDFLANVQGMVKPGGLLILAVPNREGVYHYMPERDKALDLPPHHASRWSRASLEHIGRQFNFERVAFLTEPLQYTHYRAMRRSQRNVRPRKTASLPAKVLSKTSQLVHEAVIPFLYFKTRKRIPGHTSMIIFKKASPS